MSKQTPKREHYIQLYRRKLQTDLDNMGYPGGQEPGLGHQAHTPEALIIDAGSELSRQAGDSAPRPRRRAMPR